MVLTLRSVVRQRMSGVRLVEQRNEKVLLVPTFLRQLLLTVQEDGLPVCLLLIQTTGPGPVLVRVCIIQYDFILQ